MLNVFEYLQGSAELRPGKIAFADTEHSYTFGQLLGFAESCGTAIAKCTGRTNCPVVVLTERTADSIAVMQSVISSGNFYTPLDIEMPRNRLESILNTLKPILILYPGRREDAVAGLPECYSLMSFDEAARYPADTELLSHRRSDVLDIDPVYVIFTSGSTGAPKGVTISHRALLDHIDWIVSACGITGQEVLLNASPFHFDASVIDTYMVLKCGATEYIPSKSQWLFPPVILQMMKDKGVTAMMWPTSAFHLVAISGYLNKYCPEALTKVMLGGEALLTHDLNIWRNALPSAQYINLYGPTEVTVACTWYPIPMDREYPDGGIIPIGYPCANKQVLLLDGDSHSVPDGEIGEICVRGIGLFLGYYSDLDGSVQSFVQNPMHTNYADRIYRTGDMGYRGTDGLLYFAGRRDTQIKHNGYRIELGEVESTLSQLDGLSEVACVYDDTRKRIVCFYCGTLSESDVITAVRSILPKYMWPSIYYSLKALPRNTNEKVDRVKLKSMCSHQIK